jgi:hypothetical protein
MNGVSQQLPKWFTPSLVDSPNPEPPPTSLYQNGNRFRSQAQGNPQYFTNPQQNSGVQSSLYQEKSSSESSDEGEPNPLPPPLGVGNAFIHMPRRLFPLIATQHSSLDRVEQLSSALGRMMITGEENSEGSSEAGEQVSLASASVSALNYSNNEDDDGQQTNNAYVEVNYVRASLRDIGGGVVQTFEEMEDLVLDEELNPLFLPPAQQLPQQNKIFYASGAAASSDNRILTQQSQQSHFQAQMRLSQSQEIFAEQMQLPQRRERSPQVMEKDSRYTQKASRQEIAFRKKAYRRLKTQKARQQNHQFNQAPVSTLVPVWNLINFNNSREN